MRVAICDDDERGIEQFSKLITEYRFSRGDGMWRILLRKNFPVSAASVPAGEGVWKLYRKSRRESCRLFFPFGRLHFRETVLGREVVLIILPNAGKEVIKGPDAWGIAERETAEDGIKGSSLKHTAPDSDGSYFQFQGGQVGAQHTGREPWLGSKNRIAFLQNRIRLGKIKIPEPHDKIPGAFGKTKGYRPEEARGNLGMCQKT